MPATDNFKSNQGGLSSPISHIVAVSADDGADLAFVTRGIYVGGAGDVEIITLSGDQVVLTELAAGIWHPVRAKRIMSTNTTATSILAGE